MFVVYYRSYSHGSCDHLWITYRNEPILGPGDSVWLVPGTWTEQNELPDP